MEPFILGEIIDLNALSKLTHGLFWKQASWL